MSKDWNALLGTKWVKMLVSLYEVCYCRSRGNQYIWRLLKLIPSLAASVQKAHLSYRVKLPPQPWKICLSSQGKNIFQENNFEQFGWERSEMRTSASPLAANGTVYLDRGAVLEPGGCFSGFISAAVYWPSTRGGHCECWLLFTRAFLFSFLPAVTLHPPTPAPFLTW